jgi:hypothetical protein
MHLARLNCRICKRSKPMRFIRVDPVCKLAWVHEQHQP